MRVLVGLSGGVDSAVAAYLLKKNGHEVIGATMSIWDKNQIFKASGKDACFSPHEEEDIKQAQKICAQLGIEYQVLDCTEEYKKIVLANFKQEYLNGRTPNPCVVCNTAIKFNALPSAARKNGLGFDKFATGHYARLNQDEVSGRWQLRAAVDKSKDQSYFIYRLSQEQLAQVMFPLGEYEKKQIREIAREIGFEVSDKPDSQDFYSGDINDIIQATPKTGNFVDKNGKVLGQHQGFWNFTIGQRRGLGVSADKPLYVIGVNKDKNEVILGYIDESFKQGIIAHNLAWSSVAPFSEDKKVWVKIRSSQKPVKALVKVSGDALRIEFEEAQKALTPGQSAVMYDEQEYILGGGIIDEVF